MADKVIKMVSTDLGIGDIVCMMYALNAFSLKRDRPAIRLYMRDHWWWPQMMDIPNLEIVNVRDEFGDWETRNEKGEIVSHKWDEIGQDKTKFDYCLGDSFEQYREKLAEGPDWKEWYARKLEGDTPIRPEPKSELLTPNEFKEGEQAMLGDYVIMSPFATRVNRSWEPHRFAIFAKNWHQSTGMNVYALDAPAMGERCSAIGVNYWFGMPPLFVARALKGARMVVANDSGMTHLAGWLGTPTLCVLTQQKAETHFSYTDIHAVYPGAHCVRCQFQPDKGYEEACNVSCWALQSISPIALVTVGRKLLGLDPA